jgi:capsular polysaccharide biosynthesis protein
MFLALVTAVFCIAFIVCLYGSVIIAMEFFLDKTDKKRKD